MYREDSDACLSSVRTITDGSERREYLNCVPGADYLLSRDMFMNRDNYDCALCVTTELN